MSPAHPHDGDCEDEIVCLDDLPPHVPQVSLTHVTQDAMNTQESTTPKTVQLCTTERTAETVAANQSPSETKSTNNPDEYSYPIPAPPAYVKEVELAVVAAPPSVEWPPFSKSEEHALGTWARILFLAWVDRLKRNRTFPVQEFGEGKHTFSNCFVFLRRN